MTNNPQSASQTPTSPQLKVLLFTMGSIGDTVMSIPAIICLKKRYGPNARFTALIDRQQGPIVSAAEIIKAFDSSIEFIEYPFTKGFAKRFNTALALISTLRRRRFDVAVYLAPAQRRRSKVVRDHLFFKATRIKTFLGFHAFNRKELYPLDGEGRPAAVPSEAWWRIERLRRGGLACDPSVALAPPFLIPGREEAQRVQSWLAERRADSKKPLIAIAPGAKQPANLWPQERFIEVGRRLIQTKACELVVIGGPAEKPIGEKCVSAWGTGLNAAGQFTVPESLALIKECAFLMGLDTGTTHLAAASGVPCVAIYSDKDNPGRWSPLGDHHLILRHRVPCGGCRLIADPCPVLGHPCIEGISVDMVWGALQEMLPRSVGPLA